MKQKIVVGSRRKKLWICKKTILDLTDDVNMIGKCCLTPSIFEWHSSGCTALAEFTYIKLHHLWHFDHQIASSLAF